MLPVLRMSSAYLLDRLVSCEPSGPYALQYMSLITLLSSPRLTAVTGTATTRWPLRLLDMSSISNHCQYLLSTLNCTSRPSSSRKPGSVVSWLAVALGFSIPRREQPPASPASAAPPRAIRPAQSTRRRSMGTPCVSLLSYIKGVLAFRYQVGNGNVRLPIKNACRSVRRPGPCHGSATR